MKARSRSAPIAAQLADLKMPGALEALEDVLAGVDSGGTTAAEAIERLLATQITLRNSRRLATAMRSSRLPAIKTLEDFDFSFQPSIKREQIDSLHELGFLERKENVVFLGPPGVGKTHLAISLAITAAESGRRVYYGTLTYLIDSLEEAEAAAPSSSSSSSTAATSMLRPYSPRTRASSSGGRSSTTRSWPPRCWTGSSTAATSSTSGATATGCGATCNSPRPSTRRLPGPSPPGTPGPAEQGHDACPDSIRSPRSGRSAPSAGAPEKCALFNGHKCAIFGGH